MANIRWVGGAAAIRQVSTITIANTWATNDTVTVTIANKALTVTIGSAFATTDVAAALSAAINAADATTGLVGTETRNVGGQEIPEFADISASVLGSVVTLTGVLAGQPFTVAASESTAGTGTATAATVTAATGPNHADNAANYDTGALPANNDVLYFDQGDVDCLYGLGYFRTNTLALDLIISNDWTGRLGLPAVNESGGYDEYRQRYYYAYGAKRFELRAGLQGNLSAGAIHIDFQACDPTATINVARNADLSAPSVLLGGGDMGTWTISAGNVVLEADDAGSSGNAMVVGLLYVGTPGGNNADLILTLGRLIEWDAGASRLNINSGQVTINNAAALSSPAELHGGIVRLIGTAASTVFPAFNVRNGATLKPIYGQECGVVEVFSGGTLDCRDAAVSFSQSNGATAYPGSTIRDPAGNFLFTAATSLLTLPGGSLGQITHDLPPNRVVDMTASA